MGISTQTTTAGLIVQKFIGTAYDNVKLVADNLTNINLVADNMAALLSGALADDSVTNVQLENMAEDTVKGRSNGSGTGDPEDLTAAQLRTILGVEVGSTADQTANEIETAYNNQVGVATQIQAEDPNLTTVFRWTPERVGQAIAALETAHGGTQDYSHTIQSQMQLRDYNETVNAVGAAGATPTIDITNGNVQTLTLDANITSWTFSNLQAGSSITLIMTQDAVTPRTVAWTTPNVLWDGGNDHVMTTSTSAVDIVTLSTPDGATLYGSISGQDYS